MLFAARDRFLILLIAAWLYCGASAVNCFAQTGVNPATAPGDAASAAAPLALVPGIPLAAAPTAIARADCPAGERTAAARANARQLRRGRTATSPDEADAWQVLDHSFSKGGGEKAEAIAALATINDEHAVEMVISALGDKNPVVRHMAAEKAGEMNARSAIPTLRVLLQDSSPPVSFAAAKSLYEMGDFTGRAVLLDVLAGKRGAGFGLQADVKKKAEDPLGLAVMGVGSGAGALVPGGGMGVKLIHMAVKDHSAPGRLASVSALAGDASPETIQHLGAAMHDRNELVRITAALTLGDSGSPAAIPLLKAKLKDGNSGLRCMAAASIIRISEMQSGAPLHQHTATIADR